MARRTPHHNLGDHPGHTEHRKHTGQHIAAHGHRAHGGRTAASESGRHRPNGRGLGIESDDDDMYAEGGNVGDIHYAEGGAVDDGHYQYGGGVQKGRGSRKDNLMTGNTDSGLSDTGSRTRRVGGYMYNAKGSPTQHEALDETPGFRRGGKAKRGHHRDGGTAGGMTAAPRMDHARRQRGGSAPGNRSSGRSTRTPYSSGSSLSSPANDREGRGYEGVGPA